MALLPSRVKFRKSQRGSRKGTASRGNKLDYGEFGLQTLDRGWVKNNQIEACRVAITRFLKRKGRVFIRIFPQKPVTARPLETRMGKGKGEPDRWVAVVKPGSVLFELGGVSRDAARSCFQRVAHKLPVRVRLVGRRPEI